MTLADIYRYQESLEVEYDITPLIKKDESLSFAKKFALIFVAAVLFFGLVATVVIVVYDPFYKPPVYIDEVEPPVITPPKDPMDGYVQVQVIEFVPSKTDNSTPIRNTTPDLEVLPSLAPKEDVKPTPLPAKPAPIKEEKPKAPPPPPAKPAAKPTPAVKTYSLQISGINAIEYDTLQSIAASHGVKAAITQDLSTNQTVWSVYAPSAGTGLFIEDTEVVKLSEFNLRDEAIAYAEGQGQAIIIRAENKTVANYNVELCCMNTDEAKICAQESGITNKVFRIVPR
jgi:hypothetical protein